MSAAVPSGLPLDLDRAGMLGHIRTAGAQLLAAWHEAAGIAPPHGMAAPGAVVIAAVGGSATAADYFAEICAPAAPIPVVVQRRFGLPAWVGRDTLVVVSSYSGNTEEALACYDDARRRGSPIVAITRGGELARRAAADGIPVHALTCEAPPRATAVHSLAALLRLGVALRLSPTADAAIARAAARYTELIETQLAPEVPGARNGALQIALALQGRIAVVVGASHLGAAARRFRNQLAENGKAFAAFEELPESGHNLVEGLETVAGLPLALVTLESAAHHGSSVSARFEALVAECDDAGLPVHRIQTGGATICEDLLEATAWGDFVSFYLALAAGQDPTPIPRIERVKAASGATRRT